MQAGITSVDQYIQGFPVEVQRTLSALRETIRAAAPGAVEKIAYQMPTFYFHGNLVHFAAFEHHIGFYPTPSGIEAFKEELRPYKGAKGSVQFPITEPLPLDLIARIVTFRVAETARKIASTPKKSTKPAR